MKKIVLLGISFIGIMTLAACNDTKEASEQSTQKDSATSSEIISYSSDQTSSTHDDATLSQEDNVVYGKLDKQNPLFSDQIEEVSDSYYKDGYVGYGVTDGTINVVEIDLRDLPLDPNTDTDTINEHIQDFTASDVNKIQDIDNNTFIYKSPSQNLEYKVTFTRNNDDKISFIKIKRNDL